MGLFSVFLIAVGLAMDAFAVSVVSGVTLKKVSIKQGLKFGLYFGLFQFAMPIIGWLTGIYFASSIAAIDHWIVFGLLTVIGGKMIWESVRGRDYQLPGSESQEKFLSWRNMIILAVATSIDALAVGISFALLNINILISAGIIGIVAFIFSVVGVFLGMRLGTLLGKRVEILGGVILIAIGLKTLLEHLL